MKRSLKPNINIRHIHTVVMIRHGESTWSDKFLFSIINEIK